jgi:DNA-binding protein HU-beta
MPKTKQEIIRFLATSANTTQDQARAMLESLVRLAYREARNGFVIPGLCKIELVDREARMGRNPQTGEAIEIPARKVLKIRPVSKAKEMVMRVPQAVEEEPEPPAPTRKQGGIREPIYVTFSCTACGAEIEASTDMAGTQAQCPGCGAAIRVPTADAITELAGLENTETMQSAPPVDGDEDWQKGSTIRIELPDGELPVQPIKRTVYIKRRK